MTDQQQVASRPPPNLSLLFGHLGGAALRPLRNSLWARKKQEFWHRGVKGIQFELRPGQHVDYYIYLAGAYEKRFLYFIETLLPVARTVLDIGANIGNHALFFSKVFRQVHAFEPNPEVIARLKRNVARNAAANIQVHEIGLSDRNDRLPFVLEDKTNAGKGCFVETAADGAAFLSVRVGDEIVEQHGIGDIDLIKLDVEGHELHALRGLAKTIATHQPCVVFEFHPSEFPEGYFAEFEKALPGYLFYNCVFRPPARRGISKLVAYLENFGWPWVERMSTASGLAPGKYYQNILGVPPGRKLRFDLEALSRLS